MPAADLVVVSSPLQYMNAVEWRSRAPELEADLLLIGDREGGGDAVDALMRTRPGLWRSVTRHPRRPRPSRWTPLQLRDVADARHRASLERLAAQIERCGTLVFGDYRNVSQRVLVERVAHERLVLLDDGSITPQVAAVRAGRPDAPSPERFRPGWFRTRLARSVFGERAPPSPESLAFFSIYGPIIAGALGAADELIPHRYDSWRGSGPAVPRGDDVWLLGANHVEARICSLDDYRALVAGGVAALRREGREGRFVYRPHRGEAAEKTAALARACGMTLAEDGAPAEIAYLAAAPRPALVAVVASSAADTLNVLDPGLEIVRLAPGETYLRRQRDHIRAVIAAHHAFNARLRVVSLDIPSNQSRR